MRTIRNNTPISCLVRKRVFLDPHFIIGMLDFPAGLQTSRLRFDDRWTLGAAKAWSGDPPAIGAGHTKCATAKAGAAWGASAPHVFL